MRKILDNVKRHFTLTQRVMIKLFLYFVVLFIVCVIIFEILPDHGVGYLNCEWDWLSFVGNLAGMLLACWGVIRTVESSQETARQQAILSAKPLLVTRLFNGYDMTYLQNMEGLFFDCKISDRSIDVGNKYYNLSDVISKQYAKTFTVLRIKNIGLGAAVSISPSLYRVDESEERIEVIEKEGLEYIYESVKVAPKPYYEMTNFSLGNDSSNYCIVFNQLENDSKSAHCILKLCYSDMYGKQYSQKQYLLLNSSGCRPLHISEQKEDE